MDAPTAPAPKPAESVKVETMPTAQLNLFGDLQDFTPRKKRKDIVNAATDAPRQMSLFG